MKKNTLIVILFLFGKITLSQDYDTIIHTKIYDSYFSKKYREPVILAYKLYHGGGDCSRSKYSFTNDIKEITTATTADYSHSGYDKGHLANAEDFAYNCEEDELTFRYYNCVPQTPELNRGIWKSYETKIRNESQKDSLYIICYNTFGEKMIGKSKVPDKCYKFVYSLSKKKFIYSFYCTNDNAPVLVNISKKEISKNFEWLYAIVKH